jgi:hypothetical protein
LPGPPLTPEVVAETFDASFRQRPTAGSALRAAAVDFYHQSWRLAVFNAVLSAAALAVLYLALFVHSLFILLIVTLGPLAAALMHCAVLLAQHDELRFRDGLKGLRLYWRRGAVLATFVLIVVWLGVLAFRFYGRDQWLFSVLAGDVLAVFAVVQLLAWPRAVHQPDRPLRRVFGDALGDFLVRPLGTFAFALALLIVNALGIVAAVMPFLTLTIAYSFLAAAHFALPRNPLREPF